ncbi:MAG: tRNA methyltransferase [Rhodospirillaceae bacterium]|nr:tRNA methyltransferase [Rhodospirillaceae bacterium]OUU18938.1 MAG: tRNA methyltransferase [Candidatus Endolissoclinum sp. TMED37]
MRLALFQPDIPQNTGAIIRLTVCFGIPLDIIEPCGFILSDAKLRRSSMDYLNLANIERHISWDAFIKERKQSRLVLITTRAEDSLNQFAFDNNDTLILGRESSGVPQEVHNAIPEKVRIPMDKKARSLNVSIAAGIILWEALRQTGTLD